MEDTQRIRIWLVKSHEPLPNNTDGDRMFRMGIFYTLLENTDRYEITWWSSSFSHYRKKIICNNSYSTSKHAHVKILMSPGYINNKSIRRFFDHGIIGINFFFKGLIAPKPDIIYCAFPIFSTAFSTLLLSKLRGVPYIIDYRDNWPEVYWENHLFGLKRILVKNLVYPLNFFKKIILKNSYKISTLSPEFINITSRITGRRIQDEILAFSYIKNKKDNKDLCINKDITKFIELNKSSKIVCFIGTIGYLGDVETLYKSASQLIDNTDYSFIFCGTGDMLTEWSSKFISPRILNTGFIGNDELAYILRNSTIGVLPYLNNETWNSTIPNKLVEYLSEGLYLMSSSNSESVMARMIVKHKLGKLYRVHDENDFIDKLKSINPEELSKKHERIHFYEENFGIENLKKRLFAFLKAQ